jgi:hypothetical protein
MITNNPKWDENKLKQIANSAAFGKDPYLQSLLLEKRIEMVKETVREMAKDPSVLAAIKAFKQKEEERRMKTVRFNLAVITANGHPTVYPVFTEQPTQKDQNCIDLSLTDEEEERLKKRFVGEAGVSCGYKFKNTKKEETL